MLQHLGKCRALPVHPGDLLLKDPLASCLLQFLLLDFEFLIFSGYAGVTDTHGDTESSCKYRRGTLAFRAYDLQQQKASASAEPYFFAKLTTFATDTGRCLRVSYSPLRSGPPCSILRPIRRS